MEQYGGFSDATLLRRIERLDQEERDLHQGVMDRALKAEDQGRPTKSDAQYGPLLAATKCVHEEMRDIEAELLRRSACAMAYAAVRVSPVEGRARDCHPIARLWGDERVNHSAAHSRIWTHTRTGMPS
jgi:hypothetical protein